MALITKRSKTHTNDYLNLKPVLSTIPYFQTCLNVNSKL